MGAGGYRPFAYQDEAFPAEIVEFASKAFDDFERRQLFEFGDGPTP